MKPLKTFSGLLPAICLILATSCTKSFDEQVTERAVSRFDVSSECTGAAIHLQLKQDDANGNFFYMGIRSDEPNRQVFTTTDFSDNKYFSITAIGGDPFLGLSSPAVGVAGVGENEVNQRHINSGEQLWFTLSSNLSNYLMSGFDLILHGNLNTNGRIECYKNGDLVATIPVKGLTETSTNFPVKFQTNVGLEPAEHVFFNQVRFICEGGRFSVRGHQTNNRPGLLPTTKFFLVNTGTVIYMRNQPGRTPPQTGLLNRYINQGKWPDEKNYPNWEANRQYKSQLADGELGSGAYNHSNADKWLKIKAIGGSLVYHNYMMGVGQAGVVLGHNRSLQIGESIIIEPGYDFPSGYFSAFEFKEFTYIGSKLNWQAFDGNKLVASGSTSGITHSYNFINPGVPFNKVVLNGVSPTSRPGFGGRSDQVIAAYPLCVK